MSNTPAIDLAGRTVLRLEGGDRQRYLNGQVSNDVNKLDGGNAIAACVTTLKGKLDALVVITEHEGAYLIDSERELREPLLARLDKYIIADDCELGDVSDDWHLVHVLGEWQSAAGITRRCQRFGTPGTDLWIPVGEPVPDGLELLSADEAEALRIAKAVPKWGVELTPDTLPAEAGLDANAIDFHKGCYIGQEVISRIKSVGRVNRKLVQLQAAAEAQLEEKVGKPLFDGDLEVGTITSATPTLALAYVRREHNEVGTILSLEPGEDGKKNLSTRLEIVDSQPA